MKLNELINFIKEVGFPIFIATYLLIKLEPVLKKNVEINAQLLEHLRNINGFKK